MSEPGRRPFGELLVDQQTAAPAALTASLATATAAMGARDLVLYLIDYEHTRLMPYPDARPDSSAPEVATVEATMAGRAFQTGAVLSAERDDRWQVWIPIQERANKLGVLTMSVPRFDAHVEQFCTELGYAAAYLLIASAHYSDLPHLLRRRQEMDLAAEMQWSLLPPLAYASAGTTVAGLLEPAYEVAGDCFDYAENDGTLHVAIFDAMGHGLTSAILA